MRRQRLQRLAGRQHCAARATGTRLMSPRARSRQRATRAWVKRSVVSSAGGPYSTRTLPASSMLLAALKSLCRISCAKSAARITHEPCTDARTAER